MKVTMLSMSFFVALVRKIIMSTNIAHNKKVDTVDVRFFDKINEITVELPLSSCQLGDVRR